MRFQLLIFMILLRLTSQCQSLAMKIKMSEYNGLYPLILEANKQHLSDYLETRKQIRLGSSIENYHTIYAPKAYLVELYKQPWIERIEDGLVAMRPLLDSSRILNNIDSIHQGVAPLTVGYNGQNVLMGIIDFGIEWRHLDFQNAPKDTRILGIWDQNKDSIPPSGYSYGHWWTKKDIDSGYCRHAANISNGHGTNVSGIAAGSGNVYASNKGIAPGAKIAFVSLKNNSAWLSNILDGINLIFRIADSLQIPAVINLSVGTYDGSHDGRDVSTRMMEATLNKKGRVIVAAAGNAGNLNQHILFTPNNDTSFTDFTYTPGYQGSYFNFWADTADVNDLEIGIQADSNPTLLPLSKSYFFPFKTRFLDSLRIYGYYEDSVNIYNSIDSLIGKAFFYVLKQENTVNFQCFIRPKKTTYLWRFTATGQGKLDMWVNSSLQTTSAIYSGTLPTPAVNPSIQQFKTSDQWSSIVSGFQCSDKIITVGNYVNKYGITDIDTIYRPIGGIQNEIASNSSKGPTRDGRIKPDIVSSGGQTVTTIDSITGANMALNITQRKRLGITGKYAVAGGTSMSAPVVSGTLALLLEKNKDYRFDEMIYLLKKTAKRDSFTTTIENNIYGYGKLNGFRLLTYLPSYGCRDTGSINYNPTSDFEDSTLCIKKMYGCTDTGSINYNPLANLDNGTCVKKVYGCIDTGSINYNPMANVDNGTCIKKVYGCTDTGSINYNPLANTDNGTCVKKVYGCTDTGSINYNPTANADNGTCIKKIYGCTDSFALNFNPKANVDDSTCIYSRSQIINSLKLSGFKIYPNPSRDLVHFAIPNQYKSIPFALYSSQGIKLYEGNIANNAPISLKHLAKGLYYLLVFPPMGMEKFAIFLE